MVDEILIDGKAVSIFAKVYPVRFNGHGTFPFLEEQDICHHIRSGVCAEGIIRQTDSPQQLGSFRKILAYFRRLLIHGVPGCDYRHHATGTHLVDHLGDEVIVDAETEPVVRLVVHLVVAERNVANGEVKEVTAIRGFKASHGNISLGVQLLGDTARDAVQFHTVKAAIAHAFRHHTEEVAHTHSRFQHVSAGKAHALHSIVDGADDRGAGVVSVENAAHCCVVLILCQQVSELSIFGCPCSLMLVEGVCQTAPANILGKDLLFSRRRRTVIGFQGFQHTDGFNVSFELLLRPAFTQAIIRYPVVFRCDLRNRDRLKSCIIPGQEGCIALIQCQQPFKPFLALCPHDGIDRFRITHVYVIDTDAFHNKRPVIQIEDVTSPVCGFRSNRLRFFSSRYRLLLSRRIKVQLLYDNIKCCAILFCRIDCFHLCGVFAGFRSPDEVSHGQLLFAECPVIVCDQINVAFRRELNGLLREDTAEVIHHHGGFQTGGVAVAVIPNVVAMQEVRELITVKAAIAEDGFLTGDLHQLIPCRIEERIGGIGFLDGFSHEGDRLHTEDGRCRSVAEGDVLNVDSTGFQIHTVNHEGAPVDLKDCFFRRQILLCIFSICQRSGFSCFLFQFGGNGFHRTDNRGICQFFRVYHFTVDDTGCFQSCTGIFHIDFIRIMDFQNPFIRDFCWYIVHFADGVQLSFLLRRQVAIQPDQVLNPLDCLGPAEIDVRTIPLLVMKSLSVIGFVAVCGTGKRRRMPAISILLFEKICIFLGAMRLGEILIDTGFARGKAASMRDGFRQLIVRNERQHLRDLRHGGRKLTARHGVLVHQHIQFINEVITEPHQAGRFLAGSAEILVLSQHGGHQGRVSQSIGGSFHTGRMGTAAHSAEGSHIALFTGFGRGIPIQVDHGLCHAVAFMPRCCRHFNVGGEMPCIQQLANPLGGVRPGKNLRGSGVTCSPSGGKVDTIFGIPGSNTPVFRGNAIAAVVHPAKHGCHLFQRLLFGKLRNEDHAMVAGVAAGAQNVVNILLRQRKSEGCKDRTLRFHEVIDLFCLVGDGVGSIPEGQLLTSSASRISSACAFRLFIRPAQRIGSLAFSSSVTFSVFISSCIICSKRFSAVSLISCRCVSSVPFSSMVWKISG